MNSHGSSFDNGELNSSEATFRPKGREARSQQNDANVIGPLSPAATTFTNPTTIFLPATGTSGGTGAETSNPYPSNITVSGLTGATIAKVTVTINDFRHHFPDDVDMLLVGPTGAKIDFWSDLGGSTSTCGATCDNAGNPGTTGPTITLDDAAASLLPDAGPLVSGTFKPTAVNSGTGDVFPAPAPAPATTDFAAPFNTATFANHFNGTDPNGTWSLYIIDDASGDTGRIQGGWSLTITLSGTVPTPGQLIISEFRLDGAASVNDEFIEIYNTTLSALTVAASDASAGLGVAASDGVLRCTIPSGTIIPARGHFLCANNGAGGYSLGSYPSGNNGVTATTATPNATYTLNIPDNMGIGLFTSATTFTAATKLDAVGSAAEANPVFKEGTGYPTLVPLSIQQTLFRKIDLVTGLPTDTNNNANDFFYADTAATNAGMGQHLGAPGPENLTSPIARNATLKLSLVDTGCPLRGPVPPLTSNACASQRDNASYNDTLSGTGTYPLGTLSVRRKVTNNTGAAVTRLRFRVVDIATNLPPNGAAADLRLLTSATFTGSLTGGGTTSILGLTLETPPAQAIGGGYNSSVSAGTVALGVPLAAGASINVHFLFGVKQNGILRFLIIVEALP